MNVPNMPTPIMMMSAPKNQLHSAVFDKTAGDVLDAVVAQESVDAHESEDPQDLCLLEGQAGEQVGPAELPEEVGRLRLRCEQAIGEVDEKDRAQEHVHDPKNRVELWIVDGVEQDDVHDRQHRQRADEDLVPSVLEFLASRISFGHTFPLFGRDLSRAIWRVQGQVGRPSLDHVLLAIRPRGSHRRRARSRRWPPAARRDTSRDATRTRALTWANVVETTTPVEVMGLEPTTSTLRTFSTRLSDLHRCAASCP